MHCSPVCLLCHLPGMNDATASQWSLYFFADVCIDAGRDFPVSFAYIPVLGCRHAFLSNQKVQTQSTWGYRLVELIEAESAGVNNYSTFGCRWAPQASSPTPSGASGNSTSTACRENGGSRTGPSGGAGAISFLVVAESYKDHFGGCPLAKPCLGAVMNLAGVCTIVY
jgi:hypothetical protein